MRIYSRFLLFVLPVVLLFVPAPAHAIGPGGDIYLGYSRLGANAFNPNTPALNGWQATGHLHFMPFLGVEADVAQYGLGAASTVPRTTTFMAGPRITVGAAGVHVYAHGMVGAEHSSNAGNVFSSNALAVAAGGGLDFKILPFFAWRVTADYIGAPTRTSATGQARFGTGLVFRF